MLKALTDQLRALAENSYDQFRSEVKERLNGKVTEDQIRALKEFIFLLPPTLKQMHNYWSRKSTPSLVKKFSGFIISYVYQPADFLPEKKHGLFGYLDDAYVVVSAFLRIQDLYLTDWQEKSPEELDLIRRARELEVAPKVVIPNEVARIDGLLDSITKGDSVDLEEFLTGSG